MDLPGCSSQGVQGGVARRVIPLCLDHLHKLQIGGLLQGRKRGRIEGTARLASTSPVSPRYNIEERAQTCSTTVDPSVNVATEQSPSVIDQPALQKPHRGLNALNKARGPVIYCKYIRDCRDFLRNYSDHFRRPYS